MNEKNSSGSGEPRGAQGPGHTAVAQLAEQRIPNPQVAGSIPSRRVSGSGDGSGGGSGGVATEHRGWGIYKFGQGYWVRTLTAISAGTLILACAAWSSNRALTIPIPVSGYSLTIERVTGNSTAGSNVDLYKGDTKIGTAAVEVINIQTNKQGASKASTRLKNFAMTEGSAQTEADRVRVGDLAAPTFAGTVVARDPIYLFPRVYLQIGIAALIVLVGAGVGYRLIGVNHKSVDFLVATDSEMKKVNWSTRKIIIDSTMVVIGATFLIAGFIFISDIGLSSLMRFISVLE